MLQDLPSDIAAKILSNVADSEDLIRCASVSRRWNSLVISLGLVKRWFIQNAYSLADDTISFHNEHGAYGLLLRLMKYPKLSQLSIKAVMASSTLSPDFGLHNTLIPFKQLQWSSEGREVADGTEKLTYKLPELCLVYKFTISSFKDTSLLGSPTFQPRRVNFSFGNSINAREAEFLMPSSGKRKFRLLKPILTNEQMVVKLTDCVDKHPDTSQYLIRVSKVKVFGISLSDMFKKKIEPSGKMVFETITYMDPRIIRDLRAIERSMFDSAFGDYDYDAHMVGLAKILDPNADISDVEAASYGRDR